MLAALPGCAQPGPLLSQRFTNGTLKASVSQLQFENQQLRREVATLKADNRQVEERLVQEQNANGELTARLDNARTLLSQRGFGAGGDSSLDEAGSGSPPVRNTIPAGRSSRKPRKPPFARIPGQIEVLPSEEDDSGRSAWGTPTEPATSESEHPDLGPQSHLDRQKVWLPVATETTEPSSKRR
jgi:hypothetical protein